MALEPHRSPYTGESLGRCYHFKRQRWTRQLSQIEDFSRGLCRIAAPDAGKDALHLRSTDTQPFILGRSRP